MTNEWLQRRMSELAAEHGTCETSGERAAMLTIAREYAAEHLKAAIAEAATNERLYHEDEQGDVHAEARAATDRLVKQLEQLQHQTEPMTPKT